MSVKELKCPKCGASVSRDKNVCDYCKTQYIIEERAVLFGEYRECDTFRKLSALKGRGKVGNVVQAMRLLKACRFCHIKNCEFFNKDIDELFPKREPLHMADEEFDKIQREAILGKNKKK